MVTGAVQLQNIHHWEFRLREIVSVHANVQTPIQKTTISIGCVQNIVLVVRKCLLNKEQILFRVNIHHYLFSILQLYMDTSIIPYELILKEL